MTRRRDARAILTLALLLGVFAVVQLRSKHWRLSSSGDDWRAIAAKHVNSNPEDGIYAMIDAARAGDVRAYLNCFSGLLREQLTAAAKEDAKFKAYLISQNAAVLGMAVTITERPAADEVRARVEYVYGDHNEVQNVSLKRDGALWKIVRIDGAQLVQPIVPYGTTAAD